MLIWHCSLLGVAGISKAPPSANRVPGVCRFSRVHLGRAKPQAVDGPVEERPAIETSVNRSELSHAISEFARWIENRYLEQQTEFVAEGSRGQFS
jgi:hypothetical protein